jgi:hypothetical protein
VSVTEGEPLPGAPRGFIWCQVMQQGLLIMCSGGVGKIRSRIETPAGLRARAARSFALNLILNDMRARLLAAGPSG